MKFIAACSKNGFISFVHGQSENPDDACHILSKGRVFLADGDGLSFCDDNSFDILQVEMVEENQFGNIVRKMMKKFGVGRYGGEIEGNNIGI